jgi:ubiquinone/menaquinone biosynthesis C-methylase UbiE
MSTRSLWNRYAQFFNAEEGTVFPHDTREMDFYRGIREEHTGACLEIGAGSGRLAKSLLRDSVTVALEPSDSMLDSWPSSCLALAARVQGVGEELPFKTATFPFICFPYNGIQCVIDPETRRGIVKEAFRVATPGGVFLLEASPAFARRGSEPLTERYSSFMPDGSPLTLRETVERCSETGSIKYQMFYTVKTPGGETTEKITLELAATDRNEIIALVRESGFCEAVQWGDYDRSSYNDELSPRLLVLAKKGV